MTDSSEDSTLTLKEAAALLRVSYSTVYAHREELGFFQVGSIWRVWRSRLFSLGAVAADSTRTTKGEAPSPSNTIPSENPRPSSFDESMTHERASAELDRLLNAKTPRRPHRR
jgi:excisionase family DNA binding protein